MPHITLECTDNVDMDFASFFAQLSDQLIDTGHASKMGIKCRVLKTKEYFIIDGNKDYKMVNLLYRLREGRPPEVLKGFSEIGIALLKTHLSKEVDSKQIILSTEIKELIKGQDITFNSIR